MLNTGGIPLKATLPPKRGDSSDRTRGFSQVDGAPGNGEFQPKAVLQEIVTNPAEGPEKATKQKIRKLL